MDWKNDPNAKQPKMSSAYVILRHSAKCQPKKLMQLLFLWGLAPKFRVLGPNLPNISLKTEKTPYPNDNDPLDGQFFVFNPK